MRCALPRLMIAGTGSGCGKTSITCALLGALGAGGENLAAAFKCGPDYIDPRFHERILGVPSRNLDLFLLGENTVRRLLAENTPPGGLALLEGVMGFYDGVAGTADGSSRALSEATGTPVVLVADARGKALSLAAEVGGYLNFMPNRIRGVILNRASPRSAPMLGELLRRECGVELLGCLPPLPEAALESRHLGLVTAAEVEGLREKMARLAEAAREGIDLDRLARLAAEAPPIDWEPEGMQPPGPARRARIGIAADEAFCFYYPDALALLERLGAELVAFSPLRDPALPEALDGLLLGGGYPELYAERLAANRGLLGDLRRAVEGGLPTVAECGGFLLLLEWLDTEAGRFPMAGALPGGAAMTRSLGRFGYQTLTARRDNLLCAAGETLPAHEFHYSRADHPGDDFEAEKAGSGARWPCVHATETLWAGYPHLHLCGRPEAARRFVRACIKFRGGGG